jgi:ATP-binding protein involved in chromosome partitioning
VPLTLELREGSDAGRPVTALDPEGALGRRYCDIAAAISASLAGTHAASPDACDG